MLTKEHQMLLTASPLASIILDTDAPNFSITWINPAGLLLLQARLEDLVGQSILNLFSGRSPYHSGHETTRLSAALERSMVFKSVEKACFQRYTKLASQVTALHAALWYLVIYPVYDELGKILYLVVNPQLDTSEQIKSNILESITDGFYAIDKDWTVTYWNKEAERILERPRETIIGQNLWDAYPAEAHEQLFSTYQKALTENISIQMEMFYMPKKIWMEITVFPSEEGLSVYFKHVNDRKQAEEKINEAKKQYQDLFDFNPLPQWVYNLETFMIIDVNLAATRHYGYSKDEFLSMSIRDLKPAEELEILEDVVRQAIKTGFFPKTTGKHVVKSGEIIDVQVEGNSIMFEGKPCMLVLAVDITEKTKAREDLLASEQKFKALVQHGSDLQTILDERGLFLYVNETTTRILKFREQDLIGQPAFDFVHEEDRCRVMNNFYTLGANKTHSIEPYRFINGRGTYVWLETIITNMTAEPAVAGLVANSRDVTSRIAIEQRMQKSIDRFNIVSKATSDAIWDYDLTTDQVVWNDVAKSVFGFKETIQTAEWWQNHVHPDDLDRVNSAIAELVEHKDNRLELEYRFRCEDGGYKHILDRSFVLFDETGKLRRVIGSMQDMTERVKYVQQVEAQNEYLKNFAWTQSHVVRAPLSRIMGIADLLSSSATEDNPDAELIRHLASSAAELDSVIRELVKKTEAIYKGEN